MADSKTGWELEKRTHFGEIVADYDRIRPEYPEALIRDILQYAKAEKGKRALEIGAGTGKGTGPFLRAGYAVEAVEISENMAEFLVKRFSEYPEFTVHTTAFEDVALEDSRFDLVYAASAFHWVRAEVGCPKVFRLLRSGGAVALFRYNVIPAIGEACYEAIQDAYEKHYYSHYQDSWRPVKKTLERYLDASEIQRNFGFASLEAYGFTDTEMKFYPVTRTFDAQDYIAFLDTLSDHRSLPEPNRAALYGEVAEIIRQHGDRYEVSYAFQLYMGTKA